MVVFGVYVKMIVTLQLFLTVSGFSIAKGEYDEENITSHISRIRHIRNHDLNHRSVHHFARHVLCRTFTGKQYFYKAMKTKLCGMKLSFIANFVTDLCRNRNKMLDKWVAELFDIKKDGYISHREERFYIGDN